MPISATGISTSRHTRRFGRLSAGFTLLELLVVVTIIGVFVGVAVLSTDLASFERKLEQEAMRLRNLLGLVQEESLLQSRDYGVLFTEKTYRFYYYDHERRTWLLPADDRLLAPRELENSMLLELQLDGLNVLLEEDFSQELADDPEPQVILFSSGEVTPFELEVLRDDYELGIFNAVETEKATLNVEFDGAMQVTRGTL
jgi:general secretion pathway protein H